MYRVHYVVVVFFFSSLVIYIYKIFNISYNGTTQY